MRIVETMIPDVLILEPRVFGDQRGFFFESFNLRLFREKTGLNPTFVQDNHSRSSRNVLRGLHYQIKQAQGKLVRVIAGEVFDVAVDLRRNSPTFGKWTGTILSADNKRELWIPEGFAHGFAVLSERAVFSYLCTDVYVKEADAGVRWNDGDIGVDWPISDPVLSAKDQAAPFLADIAQDRLPVFVP